jgi:hypothetical protein
MTIWLPDEPAPAIAAGRLPAARVKGKPFMARRTAYAST